MLVEKHGEKKIKNKNKNKKKERCEGSSQKLANKEEVKN